VEGWLLSREVAVDEVTDDGCLGAPGRLGSILQPLDVAAIQFERDRIHAARVLPAWHEVNTS
jgi:hypothetical protein